VPHLIVWGDFIDQRPGVVETRVNPTKWGHAIVAAGGKVDTFELPRMGIKGNTHMMMMDRNRTTSPNWSTTGSKSRGRRIRRVPDASTVYIDHVRKAGSKRG
jgi:hypothetical protein